MLPLASALYHSSERATTVSFIRIRSLALFFHPHPTSAVDDWMPKVEKILQSSAEGQLQPYSRAGVLIVWFLKALVLTSGQSMVTLWDVEERGGYPPDKDWDGLPHMFCSFATGNEGFTTTEGKKCSSIIDALMEIHKVPTRKHLDAHETQEQEDDVDTPAKLLLGTHIRCAGIGFYSRTLPCPGKGV